MDRREFRRRLAARPNNVRFEEVERLLRLYGWNYRRTSGSHVLFQREAQQVVIPFRRGHMLSSYVHYALKLTAEDDDE
jgi:predicted RNA binding protein YcfA (HicA-like mRNA interferase family)